MSVPRYWDSTLMTGNPLADGPMGCQTRRKLNAHSVEYRSTGAVWTSCGMVSEIKPRPFCWLISRPCMCCSPAEFFTTCLPWWTAKTGLVFLAWMMNSQAVKDQQSVPRSPKINRGTRYPLCTWGQGVCVNSGLFPPKHCCRTGVFNRVGSAEKSYVEKLDAEVIMQRRVLKSSFVTSNEGKKVAGFPCRISNLVLRV
jgi:hypothetical protein